MSENQKKTNPNLIISRDSVEIIDPQNPIINFKKVGSNFIVVSQNNQNICIYSDQIHDLKQVISVLEKMFEEDDIVQDQSLKSSANKLDLLVAGKLEEYESSKNEELAITSKEEVVNYQSHEQNKEQELDSIKVPSDEVISISIPDTSDSDINNLSASNGDENISNWAIGTPPNIENEDNSISNSDLNNIEENTSESVSEKKGILDKILGKTKKLKK